MNVFCRTMEIKSYSKMKESIKNVNLNLFSLFSNWYFLTYIFESEISAPYFVFIFHAPCDVINGKNRKKCN